MDRNTKAPDFPMPVVGWRTWLASPRGSSCALRSPFQRATWPMYEPLEARCTIPRIRWPRRPPHHAPQFTCECGIYAAVWRSFAPQFGLGIACNGLPVLGEVALWGDVVEAERGWRGQYAYPARLFVPMIDRKEDQAFDIAEGLRGYGVEVTVVAGTDARDILVAVEKTRRAAPVVSDSVPFGQDSETDD
ncbi:MAG TPA: hypothetical protein VH210_02945 [Gaiellaceae bacterium]|nr:hypothetical protein [Gaiellaceae bacterium]